MPRAKNTLFLTGALGALALVVTLSAKPASAQYTVYNDLSSWSAAIGGPSLLEDFSDTTLNSGLSFSTTTGSISGGRLNDVLFAARQSIFTFAPNVYAVGGNFDLTPNGRGVGLQVELVTVAGNVLVSSQIPNTANGGFFGIISDNAISKVILRAGTQTGTGPAETYNLDNLRYSSSVASVVPEPSEYAIAGLFLGTVAFGMIRSRHRLGKNAKAA